MQPHHAPRVGSSSEQAGSYNPSSQRQPTGGEAAPISCSAVRGAADPKSSPAGCAVPSTDGQSSTSWFVLRGSQGLLCLCCAWHWLCWHQLGDKPDCSCHICFENLPLVWDRPRHWLLEIAELCTSVGKEPKEKEISSWGSGGWFYFTPSPTERHHQDWPTIPEQVEQEVCKPLWIKQQHEVCAWGCRSNTGRGNSSPNLLLIYSGLQTFLLWEHLVLLEEQHHAWNHPLL